MVCPYCGAEVRDETGYCTMCFKKFSINDDAPPVEPTAAESVVIEETSGEAPPLEAIRLPDQKEMPEAEPITTLLRSDAELAIAFPMPTPRGQHFTDILTSVFSLIGDRFLSLCLFLAVPFVLLLLVDIGFFYWGSKLLAEAFLKQEYIALKTQLSLALGYALSVQLLVGVFIAIISVIAYDSEYCIERPALDTFLKIGRRLPLALTTSLIVSIPFITLRTLYLIFPATGGAALVRPLPLAVLLIEFALIPTVILVDTLFRLSPVATVLEKTRFGSSYKRSFELIKLSPGIGFGIALVFFVSMDIVDRLVCFGQQAMVIYLNNQTFKALMTGRFGDTSLAGSKLAAINGTHQEWLAALLKRSMTFGTIEAVFHLIIAVIVLGMFVFYFLEMESREEARKKEHESLPGDFV